VSGADDDVRARMVLAASRGALTGATRLDQHLGDAARAFGYRARTPEGDAFETAFEWAREDVARRSETAKGSHADLIDALLRAERALACAENLAAENADYRANAPSFRRPNPAEAEAGNAYDAGRVARAQAVVDAARAALEVALASASHYEQAIQNERRLYESARGALTEERDALRAEVERRTLCRACSDDRDNGDMHCPSCGCDL
jgi:hypothetical protein